VALLGLLSINESLSEITGGVDFSSTDEELYKTGRIIGLRALFQNPSISPTGEIKVRSYRIGAHNRLCLNVESMKHALAGQNPAPGSYLSSTEVLVRGIESVAYSDHVLSLIRCGEMKYDMSESLKQLLQTALITSSTPAWQMQRAERIFGYGRDLAKILITSPDQLLPYKAELNHICSESFAGQKQQAFMECLVQKALHAYNCACALWDTGEFTQQELQDNLDQIYGALPDPCQLAYANEIQ
jgi:hypothetical protein